ncbi:hypothetical protein ACFL6O_05085 [candidate division KSB1 bacterium]
MNKTLVLAAIILALIMISACTPGPNRLAGSGTEMEDSAGFWKGLWHGFIVLFTFVASLFSNNISIYEVQNNGNWYNFGFLLGMMAFFGGSGGEATRRTKCR